MTLKELFNRFRIRPRRAKVLASVTVTTGEDEKGNPVAAKIVFARDRSMKSWLAPKCSSKARPTSGGDPRKTLKNP